MSTSLRREEQQKFYVDNSIIMYLGLSFDLIENTSWKLSWYFEWYIQNQIREQIQGRFVTRKLLRVLSTRAKTFLNKINKMNALLSVKPLSVKTSVGENFRR